MSFVGRFVIGIGKFLFFGKNVNLQEVIGNELRMVVRVDLDGVLDEVIGIVEDLMQFGWSWI